MFNRDYLLLIYTCMCIILFLIIIILSFQSHQIRMLSAGLGMAWNRYGLSCNWHTQDIFFLQCLLDTSETQTISHLFILFQWIMYASGENKTIQWKQPYYFNYLSIRESFCLIEIFHSSRGGRRISNPYSYESKYLSDISHEIKKFPPFYFIRLSRPMTMMC